MALPNDIDRTIKVYNVSETNYELSATLQGHEGPVWQVSWSHPKFGVILASASFDGSVLIHRETRPRDWTLLHAARNLHESSVNSITFCPHEYGLMAASASSDGRVSILSHQSDNSWAVEYIQDNPLGVNAVSWAPHGAYFDGSAEEPASSSEPEGSVERPRLVTAGCDNRIRFWTRQESGQWQEDTAPISKELVHTDWVRDVAWGPNLVPNVNLVASCSEDRNVIVWKQDGEYAEWKPTLLNTFESPVWRVSWSATGHMLAVSCGDDDVSLWKLGIDGVWRQMEHYEEPQQSG